VRPVGVDAGTDAIIGEGLIRHPRYGLPVRFAQPSRACLAGVCGHRGWSSIAHDRQVIADSDSRIPTVDMTGRRWFTSHLLIAVPGVCQ